MNPAARAALLPCMTVPVCSVKLEIWNCGAPENDIDGNIANRIHILPNGDQSATFRRRRPRRIAPLPGRSVHPNLANVATTLPLARVPVQPRLNLQIPARSGQLNRAHVAVPLPCTRVPLSALPRVPRPPRES